MATQKKHYLIYALAAGAVLVAGGASAYYVTQGKQTEPQVTEKSVKTAPAYAVAPQQAAPTPAPAPAPVAQQQPACNDGNIVGTAAGAIAGGVLGNQIGKGNGKTVATIGGAAGGALVGQRYIPTHNATCPK